MAALYKFLLFHVAGIRQLQCILLKVALLLGVRVFEGLGFEELLPPPQDQTESEFFQMRTCYCPTEQTFGRQL